MTNNELKIAPALLLTTSLEWISFIREKLGAVHAFSPPPLHFPLLVIFLSCLSFGFSASCAKGCVKACCLKKSLAESIMLILPIFFSGAYRKGWSKTWPHCCSGMIAAGGKGKSFSGFISEIQKSTGQWLVMGTKHCVLPIVFLLWLFWEFFPVPQTVG